MTSPRAEAQSLANSLKYGALPLTFTVPVVTEEGPTLAADQLSAGLWAGGAGLALVLVYCMFYYRGLGLVVVASLGIAAAITYAVVLAMSQAVNFTLDPARHRRSDRRGRHHRRLLHRLLRADPRRDARRQVDAGRGRVGLAARSGHLRGRGHRVSLLAAVVLYIFAIGVVKGFAFALGISTLIDLVVFFLFTKPMVSWLARFPFFNTGQQDCPGCPPRRWVSTTCPGVRRPAAAGGNA